MRRVWGWGGAEMDGCEAGGGTEMGEGLGGAEVEGELCGVGVGQKWTGVGLVGVTGALWLYGASMRLYGLLWGSSRPLWVTVGLYGSSVLGALWGYEGPLWGYMDCYGAALGLYGSLLDCVGPLWVCVDCYGAVLGLYGSLWG